MYHDEACKGFITNRQLRLMVQPTWLAIMTLRWQISFNSSEEKRSLKICLICMGIVLVLGMDKERI